VKEDAGAAAKHEGQTGFLQVPQKRQGVDAAFQNLRGTSAHGFRLALEPVLFERLPREHWG
jgi:hypothetical protein